MIKQTKLIVAICLYFICFSVVCFVLMKMWEKISTSHYRINMTFDNGVIENFEFSTVNSTNTTDMTVAKCENKSLNEQHKTGDIEQEPWNTMCSNAEKNNNDEDGKTFYKKYRPYQIYDDTQILGSNYMTYNENPNPHNLGFQLYDKDDVQGIPVGTNYAF